MNDHQLPSNYRVSLKALIRDAGGRILLVRENAYGWGVPGGGLDHGETIEQGLRREVLEELGVEVAHASAEPIMILPFSNQHTNFHKLWLVYEVELTDEPKVGEDSDEIGWFLPEEVSGLDIDHTENEGVLTLVQTLEDQPR